MMSRSLPAIFCQYPRPGEGNAHPLAALADGDVGDAVLSGQMADGADALATQF